MKFDHQVFKFWREQRRLTLEEVGNAVGASKQTVSKWEAGRVTPREAKIRAIAKLFGISVYDISDLPPEPEMVNRSARLLAALEDPMFDIVIRAWDQLSGADKGELIEFIQARIHSKKSEVKNG